MEHENFYCSQQNSIPCIIIKIPMLLIILHHVLLYNYSGFLNICGIIIVFEDFVAKLITKGKCSLKSFTELHTMLKNPMP